MDARNLPAEELNERRREAVRMRLTGMTVAAVSAAVRLSAPTVIAAHKAYLAGGWGAAFDFGFTDELAATEASPPSLPKKERSPLVMP